MERTDNAVTDSLLQTAISTEALLAHWQGHRTLTRRVIEAFPDEQFFTYSIGGMRPFAGMVKELLAIAGPGIKGILTDEWLPLEEDMKQEQDKAGLLQLWDETTAAINQYWPQIPAERFRERVLSFGQYEGTVYDTILYFIDNEIHHRGQAYVYLRSLGIEPPYFWERE